MSALPLPIPADFLRTAADTISYWSACRNRRQARQTVFIQRSSSSFARAKLNPGGILAFRLRSAENIWTLPLMRRTVSICRALETIFPEILFLPGQTNIVTASRALLPRTPEIMSRRLTGTKNFNAADFTELHQIPFYERQVS